MNYEALEALGQKERARQEQYKRRIFCCTSTACLSAGARSTHTTLEQAVAACRCDENEAEIVPTGCIGLCSRGPLVRVEATGEDPILYGEVSAEVAQQIVARHVPLGGSDDDLASEEKDDQISSHDIPHFRASLRQASRKKGLDRHIIPLDLPFFPRQVKVVLNEVGHIDPSKLEDYLAHGGYQALHRVLEEFTPQEVCDAIMHSGLRG